MEIVFNRPMKAIEKNKKDENKRVVLKISEFEELLNPKFLKEFDCVTLASYHVSYLNDFKEVEDFEKIIISRFMDKTGYEAYYTEALINSYIENEKDLSASEIYPIALTVIKVWSSTLKLIAPESIFCFIISCDENRVTIRFHKVRENEHSWLADDIESYKQPVGYIII